MDHAPRKRLFHDSPDKRRELRQLLGDGLSGIPEVIFGYLFGSFLGAIPYEDIDVGVFLASVPGKRMEEILSDLQVRLSEKTRRPVDIRLLNSSPPGFLYHAFRGSLLVDRDEDLRVGLMEKTIMRYLDMKPLLERSLKEAMSRE